MIPASIFEGEVRCETETEANEAWCRVVARGRIVARHDDREPRPYRVELVIVEHPELAGD